MSLGPCRRAADDEGGSPLPRRPARWYARSKGSPVPALAVGEVKIDSSASARGLVVWGPSRAVFFGPSAGLRGRHFCSHASDAQPRPAPAPALPSRPGSGPVWLCAAGATRSPREWRAHLPAASRLRPRPWPKVTRSPSPVAGVVRPEANTLLPSMATMIPLTWSNLAARRQFEHLRKAAPAAPCATAESANGIVIRVRVRAEQCTATCSWVARLICRQEKTRWRSCG